MDLLLWDSSDDQVAYETEINAEDNSLFDFFSVHERDVLEEDALNEKSCIQVIKIWIDKADKDIAKLEEDILMLKCQLIWDDEKWYKQCSAALREKIDHLDALMQNFKENKETEEVPPRLHDLLNPLLENYLAKANNVADSKVEESSATTCIEKLNSREKEEEERKIAEMEEQSNNHTKSLMAISKNDKKETQQQMNNVVSLSFKEDHMKPSKKEATDDVKNVPQTTTLRIKNDNAELTCKDLRAMAKNQKLRRYSKLTKAELKKLLGIS